VTWVGLVRARDELLGILERLDTEDMTEEATRLSTATTNLFAEIYRELVEDEPAAAAGGRVEQADVLVGARLASHVVHKED
jgi:hypothetical protein